jgi:hypothetical protein
MKTTEQILTGLQFDIEAIEGRIRFLEPNAYLNGDELTALKAKLNFAKNLVNWIKAE